MSDYHIVGHTYVDIIFYLMRNTLSYAVLFDSICHLHTTLILISMKLGSVHVALNLPYTNFFLYLILIAN